MDSSTTLKINKNKYFKRVVRVYTLIIYLAIVLVAVIGFIIVKSNEGQNAEIIKNTLFMDSVDAYENSYANFIAITDQLKEDNALNAYTMITEEGNDTAFEVMQNRLTELADAYNQVNTKVFIYNDNGEVVSRIQDFTLDAALTDIDVTEMELKVAIEYLRYSKDGDFCILTNQKLVFITQKTISDNITYIICYKDLADIYDHDIDAYQVFFWGNAQNILDLRDEDVSNTVSSHNFFYMPTSGGGEVVINETDESQYRLYKSEYFDIIYCSTSQKNTTELFMFRALGAVGILVCLYIVVHFFTSKVTKISYKQILELLNYVAEESNDDDFLDGEISGITVFIRRLQENSLELKKQLDEMTIKAREAAAQNVSKSISEEITDDFVQEEYENTLKTIEDDDEIQEKFAQYVIDHISEDIGLRDLSEYFNLSFAYTSTLFKTKMQMNFKEYVSYQRYLHSLDIMRENPKLKIAEVAERVGIVNINTFIRIFKKYNDITPKQYMSMLECKPEEE